MRRSNVMEKKKPMFRLSKRLRHQAKRFCAAVLSASMVMCHVTVTGAATPGLSEFEMDSVTLYQAFQKAVAESEPVSDLAFSGEAAGDYEALFGEDVYELEPQIKQKTAGVNLRVFAKLREDSEISLDHGYQVKDADEIIFLVSNETDEEQKAVIYINDEETGNKKTEVFTVAPRSSVTSENRGKDSVGLAPSGGQGAAEVPSGEVRETMEEETVTVGTADPTESRAEETPGEEASTAEESSPEAEETGGNTESSQEGSEAETETGEEITEAATEESTEEQPEESTEEMTEESTEVSDSSEAENGTEEAETAEDHSHDSGENTGEAETDAESEEETEGEAEEASMETGDPEVSLSVHRAYRVAEALSSPSNAVIGELVDEISGKKDPASPSNAERTVMTGALYESAELDGKSVRAYVFRADELGLTGFGDVYEAELDDIIVRVSVPMGTFDDDVNLTVKKLEENTAEYLDAKTALDGSEEVREYDGMMALDIAFRNSDDEEIEPDRQARVMIEMKKSALPEEVDPESLTVHHLAEDGDKSSVEVQVVADAADKAEGTVEVNEEENLIAAFSVESFSTFTITWNGYSSSYFRVTVHYVNPEGKDIAENMIVANSDKTIGNGDTIHFSSYASNVKSDLEYKGAHFNSYNGQEVDSVVGGQSSGLGSQTRRLQFKNGANIVATLEHYTGMISGSEETKTADIYLIFDTKTIVEPPDETNVEKSLTKSKTTILNDDGSYDLNLTISGAVGNSTQKAKVDILFILDKSGSMEWNLAGNETYTSANRRINIVSEKIKSLLTRVKSNTGIDANYALTTFSSYSYTQYEVDWSSDTSALESKLTTIQGNIGGATNYEQAVSRGEALLGNSKKRRDAQTIVIFITDGLPTKTGVTGESGVGNESSLTLSQNKAYINAAATAIKGMGCSEFYAIGVGNSFAGDLETDIQESELTSSGNNYKQKWAVYNLQQLCKHVGSTTSTPPRTKRCYSATNTESLEAAFDNIVGSITTLLCDHVVVTDTINTNVELVDTNPEHWTVSVKDKDGQEQPDEAAHIIPKYIPGKDGAGPQIQFEFSPSDYTLKDGYSYGLTTKIKVSEAAYDANRRGELDQTTYGVADDTTGTYQNQEGFYSNGEATVEYQFNGNTYTENFLKPVVQLEPGTLVIEKRVEGFDHFTEAEANALMNSLTFRVSLDWPGKTKTSKDPSGDYKLEDFDLSFDQGAAVYTKTIQGLSPDTFYTVTEHGAELTGYGLSAVSASSTTGKDGSAVSGNKIPAGGQGKAEFVNTYRKLVNVTVNKVVSGNAGDPTAAFGFKYQIGDGDEVEFSLKGGETKVIEGIEQGTTVKVWEVDGGKDGYVTTFIATISPANITEPFTEVPNTADTSEMPYLWKGTITENTAVTFTNQKDITVPTGLFQDKRPYLLMLLLMIMSSISLLWTTLFKKIRVRRDEEQD